MSPRYLPSKGLEEKANKAKIEKNKASLKLNREAGCQE